MNDILLCTRNSVHLQNSSETATLELFFDLFPELCFPDLRFSTGELADDATANDVTTVVILEVHAVTGAAAVVVVTDTDGAGDVVTLATVGGVLISVLLASSSAAAFSNAKK